MARKKYATKSWLLLSGISFVVAGALTVLVTTVNGRVLSPIEPAVDLGPSPISYKNGKMEIDQAALDKIKSGNQEAEKHPNWQTVAIYARQPDADLARRTGIAYFSRNDGDKAEIAFNFPEGAVAKIVLNNVTDAKDCTAIRKDPFARADSMFTGGRLPVAVHSYGAMPGATYYLVDPGRPDSAFTVSCKLKNIFQHHTFTQRTAAFGFDDVMAGLGGMVYPGLAAGLSGFQPLPSATFNFGGIDGADQFWFYGGHQDQSLTDFESTRVLTPGQSVHLTWIDVNREQFRDVLLVMIGTLVGFAVTMFIEAIRPRIDGSDELAGDSEPGASAFPEG
jgi:hypothetical protein